MRLLGVKLENFRGYEHEIHISMEGLTVLVGKNDAGKSSVLDALDIFFNASDIDRGDCCAWSESTDVRISCIFGDLPSRVIIDDQHATSLQAEYLLRQDGHLEIGKVFSCSGSTKGKLSRVFAKAFHPSLIGLNDLLNLKIAELRARVRQRGVDTTRVNETIKAQLREALWTQSALDLELVEQEVDLGKEAGKEVWEQLALQLPIYALFRSDRPSTDQDAEAQDPLKAAIKEAIQTRMTDLDGVIADVKQELQRVLERTVEKIREMSPDLANELHPSIKNRNWDSLFTVSLTGDDDIPINKRGSGTRRLVLLNFFRAKAEEMTNGRSAAVIYAIEEPETSQHPNHQMMLLNSFETLVESGHCQVLLTTHTPTLARRVDRASLRLITTDGRNKLVANGSEDATLEKIKKTLGVLPDHDVRAFLGVEGKHDISFLKAISEKLSLFESDIPDLGKEEAAGRLVFIPLGGSNLELWISRLEGFDRPEFYLTDRDIEPPALPKYHAHIQQWTARGCAAWVTSKRELENYIHPDAIRQILPSYHGLGANFEDVPLIFAEAQHASVHGAAPWAGLELKVRKEKESRAKKRLNIDCVGRMTPALLTQVDENDEIRLWLRELGVTLAV